MEVQANEIFKMYTDASVQLTFPPSPLSCLCVFSLPFHWGGVFCSPLSSPHHGSACMEGDGLGQHCELFSSHDDCNVPADVDNTYPTVCIVAE